MKKKVLGAVVLALALAVSPIAVSAAGSSGGGSSDSDYHVDSNKGTTQTQTSTDSKTSSAGLNIVDSAVAAAASSEAAAGVAANEAAGVAPSFATGDAEMAGLPEATKSTINAINGGADLGTTLGSAFAGYKTLDKTSSLVSKDAKTGAVVDKPVAMIVEVPNLTSNITTVQVAFYNNLTGQWTILPVVVSGKLAIFTAPASGTFTFIYK